LYYLRALTGKKARIRTKELSVRLSFLHKKGVFSSREYSFFHLHPLYHDFLYNHEQTDLK